MTLRPKPCKSQERSWIGPDIKGVCLQLSQVSKWGIGLHSEWKIFLLLVKMTRVLSGARNLLVGTALVLTSPYPKVDLKTLNKKNPMNKQVRIRQLIVLVIPSQNQRV